LNITKSIIHPLLDFIYPAECISCNKPLSEENRKICQDCWKAIPLLTKDHSLYQETRARLLAEGCIGDLVSCFAFEKEGPFQHIAHALKYKEYRSFGVEMGMRIGELLQEWNIETDIIIPIPLHRIKHRERGYNQSECITEGIASIIRKPVIVDAVRRIRQTQTQTKLSLDKRKQNMKDAFQTLPGASKMIFGKTCLLVDDVITTGATTNSCAKEILAAGAKFIIAASAALAQ
jgi:competence protein ComFC